MFKHSDLFDDFTGSPVTYTWVIDNFNEYTKCKSPQIELPSGSSVEMLLHSRTCGYDHNNEHSRITIDFISSTKKVIISLYYRISLINDRGLKCFTRVGQANANADVQLKHYSIHQGYLYDKANYLLLDGKVTFYCEIFDLDNAELLQSGINRSSLISLSLDNQSLLDSGKLSDVVLVVGKSEFKAHKLILSTRSVVFEKMFEHKMKESKRNRVEITDMSAEAVEKLLKFIYTGKVGNMDEHVYELYAAADKYQIESLKSYCDLYLRVSFSTSTFSKVIEVAELYSQEELKLKCIDYITRHSAEFKFDDWKELTTTRPGLMFQVFQNLAAAKLDTKAK